MKLQITLKRSPIGHPQKHRLVLKGLGLTKIGKTVIRENTPEIRGMVKKIIHMVNFSEVS